MALSIDLISVAGRYTQALMSICEENAYKDVIEHFKNLLNLTKSSSILQRILFYPWLSVRQQLIVVNKLSDHLSHPKPLSDLLLLLTKNKRLELLPKIYQLFYQIYLKKNGLKRVTVRSANQLNEALEHHFSEILGENTQINFEVDENLILGWQIYQDDKLIDASLKRQLELLHSRLERISS